MLTIVADEAIPLVEELLGEQHHLILLPGTQINNAKLRDADALFVRTVTRVNAELIQNTAVKFVGSMTAGIDHLDIQALQQNRIHYAHAPGVNANAVAEYVVATIAWLQQHGKLSTAQLHAGIIGAGYAGTAVINKLKGLSISVLQHDPPRAERDKRFASTALDKFQQLDLLSLHVPLINSGAHPTLALVDTTLLAQQKSCVLLNTSRGEVVDSHALLRSSVTACLDVYPHEPTIDTRLVDFALLSTPHIAGYSKDAKYRATIRVVDAFTNYFKLNSQSLTTSRNTQIISVANLRSWQECLLKIYDPSEDSSVFKHALQTSEDKASCFLQQRNHYHFRDEFANYQLVDARLPEADKKILCQLGLRFV